MLKYPKPLEDLIEDFSRLPSVGKKTAERYALYVYTKMTLDQATQFSKRLLDVKKMFIFVKSVEIFVRKRFVVYVRILQEIINKY